MQRKITPQITQIVSESVENVSSPKKIASIIVGAQRMQKNIMNEIEIQKSADQIHHTVNQQGMVNSGQNASPQFGDHDGSKKQKTPFPILALF